MALLEGFPSTQDSLVNVLPSALDVFAPAGTFGIGASRSDSVTLLNSVQSNRQIILDSVSFRDSQYDDGRSSLNASFTDDNFLVISGFQVGVDFIFNDSVSFGNTVAQEIDFNNDNRIDTVVGVSNDIGDPLSNNIFDSFYVFLDVTPQQLGYRFSTLTGLFEESFLGVNFLDESFNSKEELIELAEAISPPAPAPVNIVGDNGNNILEGSNIDNKIFGKGGRDQLFGKGGKDLLKGGNGKDILTGDEGKDRLFGDKGDDVLNGGKGNDLLVGGKGIDELTGGGGKDTFRLLEGKGFDIIQDFTRGKDRLDLELIASPITMNAVGEDVEIFGGDDLLAIVIGGANSLDMQTFFV